MSSFEPSGAMTPFLATTRDFPTDEKDLTSVLEHTYTEVAQAVNARSIGLFSQDEIATGNLYIDPSDSNVSSLSFRKMFNFGAIAAGATLNIAHGITGSIVLTCIHGGALTASDTRPLPYVDATNATNQIQVSVVGSNIVIVNGSTAPAITSGNVTIEYLYL